MRGRPTRLVWLLATLALILAVVAAILFVRVDRADERSGDAARAAVAQAAGEGAAALLTYTPDTVAADMYTATQRLTGDFRDQFGRLTDTVVVPASRAQGITRTATVTGTGVSAVDGDTAEALVFLRQVTRTAAAPDPVGETVGARVQLTRVDGTWLISGFEAS
ncbi:hypothetical protein GCM10023094_42030 [Rhodococcus olei]|uniref:Mce-associated membrane protein n=1 Tax=Rhodococcus olei TaxID=2161675 RepID=A0ABP8PGA2_9NOCA